VRLADIDLHRHAGLLDVVGAQLEELLPRVHRRDPDEDVADAVAVAEAVALLPRLVLAALHALGAVVLLVDLLVQRRRQLLEVRLGALEDDLALDDAVAHLDAGHLHGHSLPRAAAALLVAEAVVVVRGVVLLAAQHQARDQQGQHHEAQPPPDFSHESPPL